MKRTLSLTLATLALAAGTVTLAAPASATQLLRVYTTVPNLFEPPNGCTGVAVYGADRQWHTLAGYGNGCPQ